MKAWKWVNVSRVQARGEAKVYCLGVYLRVMATALAYSGVWGLYPQWGPVAKPLVRGSRGEP